MRTLTLFPALLLATMSWAAPALGEKPTRWEYAELTFRATPARPAGIDADGNEVAATPAGANIRWITKDGEIEVKGWIELAEKLKAAGYKKDGSPAFQKIQFLNYLGSEGWELMEQGTSSFTSGAIGGVAGGAGGAGGKLPSRTSATTGTWLLKRRVP